MAEPQFDPNDKEDFIDLWDDRPQPLPIRGILLDYDIVALVHVDEVDNMERKMLATILKLYKGNLDTPCSLRIADQRFVGKDRWFQKGETAVVLAFVLRGVPVIAMPIGHIPVFEFEEQRVAEVFTSDKQAAQEFSPLQTSNRCLIPWRNLDEFLSSHRTS
jgi:hypothetical protein